MLVSKNWLHEFVSLDFDTLSIAEKLTELGLEVESIKPAAPDFSGVCVGHVLSLEQHPDADKLRVAIVDIGLEEQLQIVCGAANIESGLYVPVATVGSVLPGNFKIKKTKLRGVESTGMICSESEIGLADQSEGIMSLPKDLILGQDVREALNLDDDIIEIALTPNRGDCLSLYGVARELAVVFNTELKPIESNEVSGDGTSPNVKLLSPESCPFYISRTISGVDNTKPSPLWLVEKLRKVGIRSLSPVVDVTNYVMVLLGTPMHAFNASAIEGDINVRMAAQDESMTLLDGKEIKLDKDMLVVADEQKPIALAGIMGSENSVISSETQNIVLECAWFSPSVITGRARRLGLHTEASHRFERGVDFALQQKAIDIASEMILSLTGGQAHECMVAKDEVHLPARQEVSFSTKLVNDILGVEFPEELIEPILLQLGMDISTHDGVYTITPPSYRFDIEIAEDLVEELARVWGYENIPAKNISSENIPHQAKQDLTSRRKLHGLLVNLGFNESITYSFIDEKSAVALSDSDEAVNLMNPLSAELSVMRTSLIPSLVKTLSYNVNRQQTDVKLYEFGNVYTKKASIEHAEKLAGIATGLAQPLQWGYRERTIDFYDVKGDLEALFEHLCVLDDISYTRSQREFLHSGQSADILYKGKTVGLIGSLHPKIEKDFGFDEKVFVFEFDVEKINNTHSIIAKNISKYPEVRRDISILLAQGHNAEDIISCIRSVDEQLVTDVKMFDVYIGRNIPRNTKSIAIAIYLQDTSNTLTDEQADEVVNKITAKLIEKFNAELRG